jgi:hypothetical protein
MKTTIPNMQIRNKMPKMPEQVSIFISPARSIALDNASPARTGNVDVLRLGVVLGALPV